MDGQLNLIAQPTFSLDMPYFKEVGIIGLVPDKWGGPWQPRQQILTRLARYFTVVWVEPPIEWRRLWLTGRTSCRTEHLGESVLPSFVVYRPGKWLPKFYKPWFLDSFTTKNRLRQAQHILRNRGCSKAILYLWRPEFEPALRLIHHDLSCYHIDDEYTFSTVEKPLKNQEAELISSVDQVFIHSPALLEKKGQINPQTVLVPNGVDYLHYASSADEPEDLGPIPHPRIGYVGLIRTAVDFLLLVSLAKQHPEWSFVFVGPRGYLELGDASLLEQLSRMSNVHFLGGKPVKALAAYTQHLDVCIMPYKMNDYTKFIYPLKLHEYLASGRPTVGSPIRSLRNFAHVIRLAATSEEWSRALADSLAPGASSTEQIEARRRVARTHDWNTLVHLIAQTICDRLGSPYHEYFREIPI